MIATVKNHPIPIVFLIIWLSVLSLVIYKGYTNLPLIYLEASSYGITQHQINQFIIFQSYMIVTVFIILTIASIKLAEKFSNVEFGINKLLKVSFKSLLFLILLIAPSPLYMLGDINYEMGYNPLLNTLFIATTIMLFISSLLSFIKNN